MGGDATAVSDDTRNVYVEAAFWWPDAVAGRSRRFGFSTDAGHRFERGVDPSTTVEHIERITELMLQICGGQAGPDGRPAAGDAAAQAGDAARGARRQGDRHAGHAGAVRRRASSAWALQSAHERGRGHHVTPPPWRFDLTIEEDLIEEVIRVIGYDKLPRSPPLAPVRGASAARRQRSAHTRAARVGAARLPGNDLVQLRRGALGARTGRQRRPDPRAQPDRRAAGGDALEPDRQPGRRAAPQPRAARRARAPVRDRPRLPARPVGVGRRQRGGGHRPADARSAGWRTAMPTPRSGAARRGASTSSTSRAISRRCWRRSRCAARRWSIRRCTRGAARSCGRASAASACSASCTRAGARPTSCRMRRCCSNSISMPCCSARCRTSRRWPASSRCSATWRSWCRERVAHDALIAALVDDPSGVVRRATLFDIYRPKAGGEHRAR